MIDCVKKIREYRESMLLPQVQLVEILGYSFIPISRWETGRFEPNMSMKKKLAGLFQDDDMKIDERSCLKREIEF